MAHVLVVEDEPDILFTLSLALRLDGHKVTEASSGEDALAALDPVPDVVLLDLRLPGIDGWEFLDRFRDEPGCAGTPVIVVSAHADEQTRERAAERGCAAYLPKPFQAEAILSVVDRALSPG